MVDWYGRWTYEPNTPEEKKCDNDRLADWIISTGYEIKTNMENLCAMIVLYFMDECEVYGYDDTVEDCIEYVKDNGISEFDYYC